MAHQVFRLVVSHVVSFALLGFKRFQLFTDDKIGFKVDTYRYEKAGG